MFSSLPKKIWLIVSAIISLPFVIASFVAISLAISADGNWVVSGCAFVGVSFLGLLFAIPIAGVTALLSYVSRASNRHQLATYEAFAKTVNGRVFRDKPFWGQRLLAIEFRHGRLPTFVTTEYKRTSENYSHYSCFDFVLPKPIPFRCDVARRSMFDFRRAHGLDEVSLGVAEFDQVFRLRANNQTIARKCCDVDVQQGMMELIEFSKAIRSNIFDSGIAYMEIEGKSIRFRVRGVISKPEEMAECYQIIGGMVDHLFSTLFRKKKA